MVIVVIKKLFSEFLNIFVLTIIAAFFIVVFVWGDNVTFTAGPNPVVDELYLSVSGSRATSWWLYDMQGRLLGSGELADTQAVIDFSDKTTGEYVLKITNEVGSRSVLIIKK